MSHDPTPVDPNVHKKTLGDRIRNLADQLRLESDVQIKATSRILGAAAKISENHDRLIDEVVDMVEEDLAQQAQVQLSEPQTVEQLKQQFKTLSRAKAYFGLKSSSWAALATQLNHQTLDNTRQPSTDRPENSVACRLESIEREIKSMRSDMEKTLKLLDTILKKLP